MSAAEGASHAHTEHWDDVYRTKPADGVSWFRRHLDTSLELIARCAPAVGAPIIDVGGGVSTLVDDLLARGFTDLTVLDLSRVAIDLARARLGGDAGRVRWIRGDVTTVDLPASAYEIWHDRTAFHFLRAEDDRAAYRARLLRSLRPGGQAILATFAPTGPERCSGLPVHRWSATELAVELGPGVRLVESREESHRTPAGNEQRFTWVRLRRTTDC